MPDYVFLVEADEPPDTDPDEDADVEGEDSGLNEDAPVEPEEN
jgi:hypothetical protein